jgi:hypothetical protein
MEMASISATHFFLILLTVIRAFMGQFPLTLIASLVVYSVLDLPKTENSHWKAKLRRIDFLGAFSLVIAVFCLLVGLDRGSNVSWSDIYVDAFASTSLALFAIFIFIEMKIASHPFAPGHIIFERSLFASYLTNFFAIAGNTSFLFYLPLYFQAVDGMSAAGSGLLLSKLTSQMKFKPILIRDFLVQSLRPLALSLVLCSVESRCRRQGNITGLQSFPLLLLSLGVLSYSYHLASFLNPLGGL